MVPTWQFLLSNTAYIYIYICGKLSQTTLRVISVLLIGDGGKIPRHTLPSLSNVLDGRVATRRHLLPWPRGNMLPWVGFRTATDIQVRNCFGSRLMAD